MEDVYNYYNLNDWLSRKKLTAQEFRYIKDIVSTKIGMFKYKNLPDELTSEIIETMLMFNNHLCFYKNKATNSLILCRYIYGSEFNIYWKSTKVSLIAMNGKTIGENVPYEDIILCRDNIMDLIPYLSIDEYINKIREIEKTMFINLQWLRLPLAISCQKEQVAQVNAYFKKLGNFDGFCVSDKNGIGTEPFKTQEIKLQQDLLSLYQLKEKYKNECLSSMGIYAIDKKQERLITKEVEAQNDYVDFIYQEMLGERKLFIDKINKLGYNVIIEEVYEENREEDLDFQVQQAHKIAVAENVETKKDESVKVKVKGDYGNER